MPSSRPSSNTCPQTTQPKTYSSPLSIMCKTCILHLLAQLTSRRRQRTTEGQSGIQSTGQATSQHGNNVTPPEEQSENEPAPDTPGAQELDQIGSVARYAEDQDPAELVLQSVGPAAN